MEFLRARVSIGLGLAFICLFCVIYISIIYHIIDNYLSNSYGDGYEFMYVSK